MLTPECEGLQAGSSDRRVVMVAQSSLTLFVGTPKTKAELPRPTLFALMSIGWRKLVDRRTAPVPVPEYKRVSLRRGTNAGAVAAREEKNPRFDASNDLIVKTSYMSLLTASVESSSASGVVHNSANATSCIDI